MMRGATILFVGAALAVLPGCAQQGELAIRAKPTGLAAGEHPVSFRVAEARAHFALGNVALALEGFRKALREEPGSVDAMNGIAASYDRMGRFDLSRRYYEMALAVAPGDARLYANLAVSLDMQGRREEASAVRAEMASRLAAGQAASAALVSAEQAPGEQLAAASARPAPTLDVQPIIGSGAAVVVDARPIQLAPLQIAEPIEVAAAETPQPVPAAPRPEPAPPPASKPAPAVSMALAPISSEPITVGGARLERLSLGEVALVTTGAVKWKPRLAERPRGTAFASVMRPAPVIRLTLLNAARSEGLAARTRALLQRRGFSGARIAIGNAAQVQRSSVILYPAGRRAEAVRVASQFGFALRHRAGGDRRLIVVLGRDAAQSMSRRRG